MDPKQIANQMIQFNKAAVENSFNAMNMVYQQNEKMLDVFMNQSPWLPEEGRKAISDWVASYKKGCEDFKKQVDENYKKVEDFFAGDTV